MCPLFCCEEDGEAVSDRGALRPGGDGADGVPGGAPGVLAAPAEGRPGGEHRRGPQEGGRRQRHQGPGEAAEGVPGVHQHPGGRPEDEEGGDREGHPGSRHQTAGV